MDQLELLRMSFVSFLDGLWWGLRDNTGPLSMYEGYENGFRQLGNEAAEAIGGSGPNDSARIAGQIMDAMGLKVEVTGSEISVKECPLWNRILEKGLEFAFHVEEICWAPLLKGIAERTGAMPKVITSLRLNHIAMAKIDYKKGKAKKSFDKGEVSQEDYDSMMKSLENDANKISNFGQYRFE
ncbi:MAG: hypothetical protein ACFFDR_08515 [Candidatus Thorarchaeota archaeon]